MPAFNEAEILESSVKSVVEGLRARGETLRGHHRRERLDRRHRRRSPTRSPRRSPRCAPSTAPTPTTAARCAPGCSSAQRRRGRQLRHRLLRPRTSSTPRSRVSSSPTVRSIVVGSKRGEGATDDRAALRKLATAVFSTMLRVGFGLHVSDTHGIKAMRRDAVEPFARGVPLGSRPLRHRADPARRARRAAHRGDPGRRRPSCGRRARRS